MSYRKLVFGFTLIITVSVAGLIGLTQAENTISKTEAVKTTKELSLSDQIKALEASGALPKLDRSTDIKGPDQNLNGVRDDIEAWINAQPITDLQKKGALQRAEAFQATLFVDLTDKVALQAVGDNDSAAFVCLINVFDPDTEGRRRLSNKIETITFNTKERTMRYIAFNKALSGMSFRMPFGQNTCK